MRRLTIAAFASLVVLGGLYFMIKMFFGGIHLSIYQPPNPIFEPDQRAFVPEYPTPQPTFTGKIKLFGPANPKDRKAPPVMPGPPMPEDAFAKTSPQPDAAPTPVPAATFAPVTPPPLPNVEMPVGFRNPAASPAVTDVGAAVMHPTPMPKPSPSPAATAVPPAPKASPQSNAPPA